MLRNLQLGLMVVLGTMAAASASAAPITWNVFNITGDSDVSTNGTSVIAYAGSRLGGGGVTGASIDVNTVTFYDNYIFDSPSHFDDISSRVGSGIGGNYYTMLRVASRQSSGTATFTFTNLTSGAQYEIQIWHTDNVSTAQDNGVVLNDGGTNNVPTPGTSGHVTLLREVAEGGPGQYALGVFKASSSTQQFLAKAYGSLLSTPSAQANVTINGVQLRLTAPPSGTLFIFE